MLSLQHHRGSAFLPDRRTHPLDGGASRAAGHKTLCEPLLLATNSLTALARIVCVFAVRDTLPIGAADVPGTTAKGLSDV